MSVALAGVGFFAIAPPAGAAPYANFGSFGAPNGPEGGQLVFARGVAANRSGVGAPAGSVYVAEATSNHRISQFTADGEFVRSWGWDVVSSGPGNDVTGTPNEFEICVAANGDVCKAGVTGGAAGQLANPSGIAVDQSNGFVYVTSTSNRRVDVFSGTGEFAGAFGWDVDPGGVVGPEVCTTVCKAAGTAGGDAGRFGALATSIPAVDPNVAGRVYVPDPGNLRVAHYETTVVAGTLASAAFVKAFGWDVDPAGGTGLESCTVTCKVGVAGAGAGQFTTGSPTAVAVDSTGAIYATSGPTNGNCTAIAPCRVQKFAADATSAADFGPASEPGQLRFETGTAQTVAPFNVAVDPSNDHVFVQRRASASSYQVLEYDSDGTYLDTHPAGDALPTTAGNNSAPGLAIGAAGRVYANLGVGGAGTSQVFILGPVPPPTVTIGPVTDVGATSARFNGTVTIPAPGSPTFTTRYHFEYSSNGVDWTNIPVPDGDVGDGTTGTHPVIQRVTGLNPNTLYSVRLVATTGPTATSSTVSFTTGASAPRVAQTFVDRVTQTEARLGAHIDPEGLATTYHFEWGPTAAYGNRVPAFERQLGDGTTIVVATEQIAGLTAATAYHYRVVATNAQDTTVGPDRTFETLNSCNLTDGRCFELVSPPDKGPTGNAGALVSLGQEQNFQVAPDGSAVQYVIAYGAADSRAGDEASYRARRGPGGWSSEEIAAPHSTVYPRASYDPSSRLLGLSSDLSCGFFASTEPLTEDVPAALLEGGGSAIYKRDDVGAWTTVTTDIPTDTRPVSGVNGFEHTFVGMSDVAPLDGCQRAVFHTPYHFPSAPGAGHSRLYRWDEGVLSYVGVIPGPGGPEVAEAVPGATPSTGVPQDVGASISRNTWKAVSQDASRVFFTARSRVGGDVGQQAVFVRELGSSVAVDVSQSRTATANNDASVYQTASTDGSKVFFTGRTGLAPNDPALGPASCADSQGVFDEATGCDLYVYSVGGDGVAGTGDDELTDLSVPEPGTSNPGGVGVMGILDASDDGEYVYFAARGQLVEGEGYSAAENVARDTFSVYLAHGGEIDYIGRVREDDGQIYVSMSRERGYEWSSQATPDGRHLVFESGANPTGYDSAGNAEAFIYSADNGTLECMSCRTDRKPPAVPTTPGTGPLWTPVGAENYLKPPRSITDDGSRVFFVSSEALATGATVGTPATGDDQRRTNLYQWKGGQVSFIATSENGGLIRSGLRFGGTSSSGDDVFFATTQRLSWEDVDFKSDIYDARVGGGFPKPADPPAPCDALTQGSCQGGGAPPAAVSEQTSKTTGGETAQQPRAVVSVRALTRPQRARLATGRKVRVLVRVNRPGMISVRGTARIGGRRASVMSGSVRARRAGRYAIPVSLSRRALRRIGRSGALPVTLTVRLAGTSKPSVRGLTVKTSRSSKRPATNDRRAGK